MTPFNRKRIQTVVHVAAETAESPTAELCQVDMVLTMLKVSPTPNLVLCHFPIQGRYLTDTTAITIVQLASNCLQLAVASQ